VRGITTAAARFTMRLILEAISSLITPQNKIDTWLLMDRLQRLQRPKALEE
jgi:hypothetical protein